jgi:hypothetical protein
VWSTIYRATFHRFGTSQQVADNQAFESGCSGISIVALSKLLSGRAQTYRPGFFARLFASGKWKLTLDPRLSGRIRLRQDSDIELACLDIVSISASKALL